MKNSFKMKGNHQCVAGKAHTRRIVGIYFSSLQSTPALKRSEMFGILERTYMFDLYQRHIVIRSIIILLVSFFSIKFKSHGEYTIASLQNSAPVCF